MRVDQELLERFEAGLDPQHLDASAVPARLVGYGEISAIFQIGDDREAAYKRMPLFRDREEAAAYDAMYQEYCRLLERAGLSLPESGTAIVEAPGRPVVLYIAQALMPEERFGHRLIHSREGKECEAGLESIMKEAAKVWRFCEENGPQLEIAIDGQLSNWVLSADGGSRPVYIDTSTPLIRKNGAHQLDPKLILQAAPKPLRGLFEWLFADDVMSRYFDPEKNMIDLVANLFKEQRPDLVPVFIEVVNRNLPSGVEPLTAGKVKSYYREDKLIWTLFLGIRRVDRWLATRLFGRRYEFILPGKIKR